MQDVVGLGACPRADRRPDPWVDPPEHALVLSVPVAVDEKSQIQALDRTQPGLPMKRGRCGTMTHDYKHHGTTTLFAALDVLEGLREWAYARAYHSSDERTHAMQPWITNYNYCRPHSALAGKPPATRLNNVLGFDT